MPETATTDTVLTAYFLDTNGICDKLEAKTGVLRASTIVRLTELDAKHAAGTAFNTRDKMFMVKALREYFQKQAPQLATTDTVLTAYFLDTNGLCDKLEAKTGVLKSSTITRLGVLDAQHAATTAFDKRDMMFCVYALEEYLLKA